MLVRFSATLTNAAASSATSLCARLACFTATTILGCETAAAPELVERGSWLLADPPGLGGTTMLARYAAVCDYEFWEALEQVSGRLGYAANDDSAGFGETRGQPIVAPVGLGDCAGLLGVRWRGERRRVSAGDRACTYGQLLATLPGLASPSSQSCWMLLLDALSVGARP